MATIPTQNAVPSEAPRDLKFNSGKIDEFVTSLEHEYKDRFGRCHMTIEGMRWIFEQLMERFKVDINQAIIAAGYIPMDSFQQGAEITKRNEILRDETTGEYYRWDGDLPKSVPAGSTPESAGGVGMGAWVSVGDASLRGELNRGDGILVGTNHRGNLALDLDAIDRRPDGYNNDIQAVLDNGNDVEINKDIIRTKQVLLKDSKVVNGVGGSLHIDDPEQMTSYQHALCADKDNPANSVIINDVVVSGSTTWHGKYGGFGVYLEKSKNSIIDGLNASGFSGAVALRATESVSVKNINGHSLVYDPKEVRGGYGIILDECRDTIIDGVLFKATDALDNKDGRHLLYVAHGGNYFPYNACINTICTNTIANYTNKNDRNQWSYNFRKSKRNILSNFIADDGNGGIANNNERGPVENSIYNCGHLHQVQYQNSLAVGGTSFTSPNEHHSTGWIINSVISEVSVKDSTITGEDSIGFGIAGKYGIISSCITKVPPKGVPIMIQDNAYDLMIDGILDYTDSDNVAELSPMITFGGNLGKMKGITIRGVKTKRPMFRRITAAIDVTVDFTRQAKVTLNSGSSSKSDDYELIKSISVGDASISIVLHDHVTQPAVDSCYVRMFSNQNQGVDGYVVITSTANKTVGVRFYNTSGQMLNPKQAPLLSCLLVLIN